VGKNPKILQRQFLIKAFRADGVATVCPEYLSRIKRF